MTALKADAFCAPISAYSSCLTRTVSDLTSDCVIVLDAKQQRMQFGTHPEGVGIELPRRITPHADTSHHSGRFAEIDLCAEMRERLAQYNVSDNDRHEWFGFGVTLADGTADEAYLRLDPCTDRVLVASFLSTIWRILREDVLQERQHNAEGPDESACDDALLWMISQKIGLGVMVMNAEGLMLRANAAAKAMLLSGDVLQRSSHGIIARDDLQSRLFRDAITECSHSDDPNFEKVVLLDSRQHGRRVPVTLARFRHEGKATDLVTVLLPTPPQSEAVFRVAKSFGLTKAEARIAALLQLGLSNKEVSKQAGLTEQSSSTYCKRVLSKMNVHSRAEIAQLLTWQSNCGGTG
ncbi:regulatory protein, luxR family [Cognatiyoonia koreensis]|uniref:Regulatory protein, luxR family n=1 Tax=Cognatiyoonia koreensis TaxID=364200 RepID=A0A1I0RLF6_9RHOB|nr:LuxR C-terminal-related transcriptional regulator [Cognatiyoonia koreensis]SEW41978.1 regulatory protein, luxR family [Cognatiyoonia koreensis]